LIAAGACRAGGQTRRPSPSANPSGEAVVSYPREPASLDPYSADGATPATSDLLRPVLPTLLGIDSSLHYTPSLATRVPSGKDVGDNPFSVTYHLDPRARWSDAAPITSGDVRFTWQVLHSPDTAFPRASYYRNLTDVVAVDAQTVKLVFDKKYAPWRDLFSAGDFILPSHLLAGNDPHDALKDLPPVSGGPYRIESWTRGLEIVYAPNPGWWGSRSHLARVRVEFVPDITTAIDLLAMGKTQALVTTTQLNLAKRLEKAKGANISARFGADWWELAFNTRRAGVSDLAFRQAVAYGIERAGAAEALFQRGSGGVAAPRGTDSERRGLRSPRDNQPDGRLLDDLAPGHKAAESFSGYRRDLGRAISLLDSAGWAKGGDGNRHKKGVDGIGISAPENDEMGNLLEHVVIAGMRDAGVRIEATNPGDQTFYGSWMRDARFDLAVRERRAAPGYAPEGMDQAVHDLPVLPLAEVEMFVATAAGLKGADANASADGPFWNLTGWTAI
jgi:peptide/nickel transport system substrate-binding protein